MRENSFTRVSLDELALRKQRGELRRDADASESEGEALGADFWATADAMPPKTEVQPVLLKLDREVLEFFRSGGPGHITRMQNVLRSHMKANRQTS